ncbi:MAG: insulinase family protein [Spirochaetaceae bacterium]|nr:MAG: insulinase family protein [Spirochaetaceae bacterium]
MRLLVTHAQRLILAVLILLLLPLAVGAQSVEDRLALPIDSAIRHGQLENGVRYIIRKNEEPAGRAFLRLVVNAGSTLETENQLGLAHFVEHMAFNGTEDFEKDEIIAYLESLGMRFGPDVNAYTSFEETVYMLQLPTDSTERLERAFHILENWAHKVSFDPEEVERERGVILEEWRVGLGAQTRLRDAQFPILFQGSRYADRLPIGKPEVFMNAPREELLAFYREWYRPELMSVIAVGDFDKDLVEGFIHKFFGRIESRDDAPERPEFLVPEHTETLFAIASDPEAPRSSVAVYNKRPPNPMQTRAEYRERLADILYAMMMNERFSELSQASDAPFLQASAATGRIVRAADVHLLQAVTDEGGITAGLEAIARETQRVQIHGFSEVERELATRRFERSMRTAYNERERTPSDRFMVEYTSHVLHGEAIPGIQYEYALTQELLPEISLEELNARAEQFLSDRNRVVMVTLPERAGLAPPTEVELASALGRAETASLTEFSFAGSDGPLIDSSPEPGEIISEIYHEEVDATEWMLNNGVRVVWKNTEFRSDEVQFSAFATGGTSFANDDRVLEARKLKDMFARSGVAEFSQSELDRLLAGSSVRVEHVVESVFHGLAGRASTEDLDTLFQLIHLQFTKPRLDEQSFENFIRREEVALRSRATQPFAVFQDRLTELLSPGSTRTRPFRAEMLGELNRHNAIDLHHDLYGNAGAFTFVFVGNITTGESADFKELVLAYLGSLPNERPAPRFHDRRTPRPEGRVEDEVRAGIEDAGRLALVYHGEHDWSQEQNHLLASLADVLRLQLRDRVRERESGTYSVGVQRSISRFPEPEYLLLLSFGADPAQLRRLAAVVEEETLALASSPETAERYLDRVKETQRREHEQDLRSNSYWNSALEFAYKYERPLESILAIPDLIGALTAERIRAAAEQHLVVDRSLLLMLYPVED